MRNSKGISVLALVITVIVIVIITSITIYTGVNMISDARKKDAEDKLKIICNALRRDDSFLGFDSGDTILTEQDYVRLELEDYYDEDYPVYLKKSTVSTSIDVKREYTLEMYKGTDTTELYVAETFSIVKALEKNVYEVSFDDSKGVNRPIITSNMHALNNDGMSSVEDVYEDSWYSYNSAVPSFAKMKYDSDGDGSIEDEDKTYMWIPRYAYSIQTFYDGSNQPSKTFRNVPSSAIQIVFLRENTNYMNNGEVIPAGFRIHPAFTAGDTELSGFWIQVETSDESTTLSSAISEATSVVGSDSEASSHLMTNSEYAATLYLMFAMDYFNEINFTLENEFVAAGLSNSSAINNLEYADLYVLDSTNITTGIEERRGDAMLETNWNRLTADYPTTSKPCIVRLLKSGYFDFTSVSNSGSEYYYRAVIVSK